MFNKTLLWTALFGALFTTIALKFLQLFNFINWSPVGWAKKWQLFAIGTFYNQMGFAFYSASIVICDSLFCRFIYNINSTIYYSINHWSYRCFCG